MAEYKPQAIFREIIIEKKIMFQTPIIAKLGPNLQPSQKASQKSQSMLVPFK